MQYHWTENRKVPIEIKPKANDVGPVNDQLLPSLNTLASNEQLFRASLTVCLEGADKRTKPSLYR